MNRRSFLTNALATGVATILPQAASAAGFAGQTITVLIPFGVGGGNDPAAVMPAGPDAGLGGATDDGSAAGADAATQSVLYVPTATYM